MAVVQKQREGMAHRKKRRRRELYGEVAAEEGRLVRARSVGESVAILGPEALFRVFAQPRIARVAGSGKGGHTRRSTGCYMLGLTPGELGALLPASWADLALVSSWVLVF